MPYDPITGKWRDPKVATTQSTTPTTDPSDPNAPTGGDPTFHDPPGSGASADQLYGAVMITQIGLVFARSTDTPTPGGNWGPTVPFTWAAGDWVSISGTYFIG